MISSSCKKWFSQLWHPSDEDLLGFLDGEATSRTARRVRRHLERCWSCRTRREELDLSIGGFIRSRENLLASLAADRSEADGGVEQRFQFKLRKLACQENAVQPVSNLSGASRKPWHLRLSLPVAASLLAAAFVFYSLAPLNKVRTVSAQELLRHATEAETRKMREVKKPVVHRKLRVARKAAQPARVQAITWESWSDAENRRFAQRVAGAAEGLTELPVSNEQSALLLAELETIFRQNDLNLEQPLSAEGHDRWRQSLQTGSEEVIQAELSDGEKAFILRTAVAGPYRTHSIRKAEFVVRTGDWHPVEHRLSIQGQEGVLDYELIERTFEVVTLAALPLSLFAELLPPVPSPLGPSKPALPSALSLSETDSLAIEIQAHYVLHQLKACLGKPIHVNRGSAGRLRVSGLVDTEEERNELQTALSTVPGVTVAVQTVAEAVRAASQPSPSGIQRQAGLPPMTRENEGVTVRTGRMPLQQQLQQFFSRGSNQLPVAGGGEEEEVGKRTAEDPVARLSNGAVTLSRNVMAEAWALRRLAERYREHDIDRLPRYSRLLLQNMLQDHLSSVRLGIEKARQLLEPALSSVTSEKKRREDNRELQAGRHSAPFGAGKAWNELCLELFGRADEAREMVDALFAGTELETSPEETARRLVDLLSHWARQFEPLEIEIARQFSSGSSSLTQTVHDGNTQRSAPAPRRF